MMRTIMFMALIAGGLWGCSTANLPEVPVTHPANVKAPQASVTAPSDLLTIHHAAPGTVEGRQLNRGGDGSSPMNGSTMPGMSEEAMGGMDHGEMDHGEMDQGDMTDTREDEAASVYTCSMHPEVRASQGGYCPICGMTLIPVKPENSGMEGMDHGNHTSR